MRKLDLSTERPIDVARSIVQQIAREGRGAYEVHVRPGGRVVAAPAKRKRAFPLPTDWLVGTYTAAATADLIAGDLAHHMGRLP